MLRLLRSGGSREPDSEAAHADRADAEVERPDPLRALAVSAAAGNDRAQRTLCAALGRPLLHVLRSAMGVGHPDIEDLLQESLTALLGALPGFQGQSTTLHFACRVTLHTAMNARRKAGHRRRHLASLPPEELEEMARHESSPAELVAATRRRETLRRLLDELPVGQAEVIGLHTMLGHTVEETARALGIPANTVRSRLRTALGVLRDRLRDDDGLLETMKGDA
jgi:RNA polymerase sigma-70 factor (ECF subfamily)